jgi:hypothetical protein
MMKNILYLFLCLGIVSCTDPVIQISSDFDHGSIGNLEEWRSGHFRGSTVHWLKRDSIGDQYYWFYFKVKQDRPQKLTFELENLEGVYRGKPHVIYSEYTQPVFSYDQKSWNRIESVNYDSAAKSLKFSYEFESSPVWIAYAHPYPYERLVSFISSISGKKFVNIEEISKTKEGRGLELISITDPQFGSHEKKTVFLIAMQHSGEDASTFYLEGLINFLLSEDEDAARARRHFDFKLIPMMNPDGVFHGTSRYNAEMEDLNNIWFSEEKMQPEVEGVQRWFKNIRDAGRDIDLFVDVHNHTQFYTYNVFLFNDSSMDILRTVINKHWPSRIWHSEPVGSAHAYFVANGIPGASLELTQSFSEAGAYLDIADYHHYGAQTVRGLLEYYGFAD